MQGRERLGGYRAPRGGVSAGAPPPTCGDPSPRLTFQTPACRAETGAFGLRLLSLGFPAGNTENRKGGEEAGRGDTDCRGRREGWETLREEGSTLIFAVGCLLSKSSLKDDGNENGNIPEKPVVPKNI